MTDETTPSSKDTIARPDDTRWLALLRSSSLLSITGGAVAVGWGLKNAELSTPAYLWQNVTPEGSSGREDLLGRFLLVLAVGALFLPVLQLLRWRDVSFSERSAWWVRKVLPLGPLAIAPLFFDWELWGHHDRTFLIAVLINALAMGAAVKASLSTAPVAEAIPGLMLWVQALAERARPLVKIFAYLKAPRVWFILTAVATCGYIVWFGYHTAVWHLSVRSGYDLAIENNILYNLVHGGPFFKATPTLGPTGSHFGRHATLVAYLLLPFYALHQSAETILIIQSFLMGIAALPLFLFARRRVGGPIACAISLAYLMHPALQQSNLFEAHYVKFGLPFVWTLLWLVDSGRTKWALLVAGLTLSVREDVAAWVVMVGLWAAYTGRSFRLGLLLTAAAGVYVVIIKLVVMPTFTGGADSLMFMYEGLLPKGKTSFAWVLGTAVSNPGFVLNTLIEDRKITYLLQLLVPLGLLPLRHRLGWFALIPGGIFCMLATNYPALTNIHFQYSPHFLAFLLPAAVIAIEESSNCGSSLRTWRASQAGMVAVLAMATLPTSYQYGAVLQGNTSMGGPIHYLFGWDEVGEVRARSMKKVLALLPPDARVGGSAYIVPQISARSNGYSLSLGMYDADWIVAPSDLPEFILPELQRVRDALRTNEFGVVTIEGPFFVARRGHDTALNASILNNIGRIRDPRGKRPLGQF